MRILITNDDGVNAAGLQALVGELKYIAEVIIVAPDREQSAVGTALTLRQPIRVQKAIPVVEGVETYAVSGTPGDSVIMGISRLVGRVDLVISGINHGPNLGDDIFISGTVGGALQGYLHGISSFAVSMAGLNGSYYTDLATANFTGAAKFVALLAEALMKMQLPRRVFLNVNIPDLASREISGIRITRPSTTGYADTVEEGHDGKNEYYWLKHRKASSNVSRNTDAWAISRRQISITPLHTYLFGKRQPVLNGQFTGLLDEIKSL